MYYVLAKLEKKSEWVPKSHSKEVNAPIAIYDHRELCTLNDFEHVKKWMHRLLLQFAAKNSNTISKRDMGSSS